MKIINRLIEYAIGGSVEQKEHTSYASAGQAIVCVLDESGSMNDLVSGSMTRLEAGKEALITMAKEVATQAGKNMISILGFGSDAIVYCDLLDVERKQDQILTAVSLLSINGTTNMYSGLEAAADVLGLLDNKKPKKLEGMAKRIVFLSDGHNSGCSPNGPAKELKNNGVIIDTIGIAQYPEDVDEDLLKKMASVVNGKVRYRFIQDDPVQLGEHFKFISKRIVG